MEVDPEIACGIVGNIGQLWLDGQFNDLQIHVGDIQFSCSRFIFCACSKFFKAILTSEVIGEAVHLARQVTIRGISPEIFQLVLKAMYQGENGLSTENIVEFWHAVHQLDVPILISKCETFLSSHLTLENFVNIYQNALLLKSRNVIIAAHHFVAKNFESFKELDILLQQPASYIEEIIGDDSLVGQCQNHVVEFILKWVNYEFYASEVEPVSADSSVGDLSAQTSEVTGNNHVTVEVNFPKPHAVFGKDCTRNLSGLSVVRKQSLGTLLKLVKFTEVSKDSLQMLADDDLIMGSKQSRDIVRQAMELVNSAPTSDAITPITSTPATSIDTEDTVVFAISSDSNTIFAYSLDRGGIFQFLSTSYQILNICTYHNKLLCRVLYCSNFKDPYSLSMTEFPFSSTMSMLGNIPNEFVKVEDVWYTFKNDMYMYRRTPPYGKWYPLFALPIHMSSPSLAVLKHSILYYNSKCDQYGKQEVYCFNTKSRRHWHMMTCDYEDCDFVTLIHNDQLYILYGNGVFLDVTNCVICPTKAFSLPTRSEISKNLLWDFKLTIYGAVVHQENLMVFGDLTSVLVSEILECKIPGLKAIKFVHLCGLLTKCHPLVIPKKLLLCQM